ncbi:hypothetical protein EMCG_07740 [[Emmonsia] crescens]|uniref:Uncharacterized protein n=1 Tax=[Emmonsia] crescens TaxID=73230 RepID=A0A0G2I7D9_9EURO|nr:hypothetical protein EMCG_07740 [Emmonsia crescens UAMH 3008]
MSMRLIWHGGEARSSSALVLPHQCIIPQWLNTRTKAHSLLNTAPSTAGTAFRGDCRDLPFVASAIRSQPASQRSQSPESPENDVDRILEEISSNDGAKLSAGAGEIPMSMPPSPLDRIRVVFPATALICLSRQIRLRKVSLRWLVKKVLDSRIRL